MKTTRSIETNADPKEEGTIRYWANCIAWFSKLKNISQVTIKSTPNLYGWFLYDNGLRHERVKILYYYDQGSCMFYDAKRTFYEILIS